MIRRSSVSAATALGVAMIVVLGAGIATAARSGDRTQACASKSTGALRVAARCTATERPVALTGGKRGKRGPRGPRGPRGAQGPSDLYQKSVTTTASNWALTYTSDTTFATVALPAGAYQLTVTAIAFNQGSTANSVYCYAVSGSGSGPSFAFGSASVAATNDGNSASLSGTQAVTFGAPTSLALKCGTYNTSAGVDHKVLIESVQFDALRVGRIHAL